MKPSQIISIAIFTVSSMAKPSVPAEKSMMAAGIPQWIIEGVQRTCNTADTECKWTFEINPVIFSKTPVHFITKSSGSTPASRNIGESQNFGDYTISSGWSGQFGLDKGFTTLSVIDHKNRRIAWPAYADRQIADCQVVTPNQSYASQTLP
ncbi:hypothetical protein QQS21_004110 [Conoideocrella luteorostrata]|uniref:Uncharacterized protein n=1 Tax=Conoideocrella luteorostrata TaxID=1105319 RepID=A0AAJ0CS33_9HYPO|nr:hypothetical protein QQS21_004110 [Conoideocrella luteorostrata]